jgi:outer membrane protein assembly factor BamB
VNCAWQVVQLGCVDPRSGEHLWQAPLGGFPFDLKAADLDADGTPEALVACSDGALYVFSANGKSLWAFRPGSAAMNQVVICRDADESQIVCGGFGRMIYLLTPSGKEVAQHDFGRTVHQLAAVDMDGDERDEVLAVAYKRKKAESLMIDSDSIRSLGQRPLPDISSPRGRMPYLVPYSTAVGDLDEDGRPEIVCGTNYGGGSRVAVIDNGVELKWVSQPWRGLRTTGFERRTCFA